MDKPSIPPLPSSPSCSVESQKTRLQWKSLQISVKIKRWREFCGYQGLAGAQQALRQGVWRLQFGWKCSSSPWTWHRRLHLDEDFLTAQQDWLRPSGACPSESYWRAFKQLKLLTQGRDCLSVLCNNSQGPSLWNRCSEQSPMQGLHLDDSKSPD